MSGDEFTSLSDLELVSNTTEESHDTSKSYTVEMILAERRRGSQSYFLVKWDGEEFPLGYSTWEPRRHLGHGTIETWERFKRQTGRRTRDNFRVSDYWEAAAEICKRNRDKHEARNRRRELRGQQPKPYDSQMEDQLEVMRQSLEDFEEPQHDASHVHQGGSLDDVDDVEMLDVDDARATTEIAGGRMGPALSLHQGSSEVALQQQTNQPIRPMVSSASTNLAFTRNVETARKTAKNSVRAKQAFTNVFIDGKKRKKRGSLSDAMSDQTKDSRLLSLRKQNIGNKQLRDGEGSRRPSGLPTSWMQLGSENADFVRLESNPQDQQKDRNEIIVAIPREQERQVASEDAPQGTQENSVPIQQGREPGILPSCLGGGQNKKRRLSVRWGETTELPRDCYSESEGESEDVFVQRDTFQPDTVQPDTVQPDTVQPDRLSEVPLYKLCQLGRETKQSVHLTFLGLADSGNAPWLQRLRGTDRLVFSHTCTAADWNVAAREICKGKFGEGFVACADDVGIVATRLKISGQGLVYFDQDWCIVVVASKCEEWYPMFHGQINDATTYSLAHLVFQLHGSLRPFLAPISCPFLGEALRSNERGCSSHLERLLGVSYYDLVPLQGREAQQQNFFLMFPPRVANEAQLVHDLLSQAQNTHTCHIRTNLEPGGWNAFKECGHGTTIVHEDAVWMIRTLPGLCDLLSDSSRPSRIFWLFRRPFLSSTQPLDVESAPLSGMELRPIFTQGQAWLMTPSFLMMQPEEACRMAKLICSPGTKVRKLVLCADIERWLLDLALEKQSNNLHDGGVDLKKATEARVKLWVMISTLIRDSISTFDDGDEFNSSPLVFAPDMIDGNDEQSLVNWFGWWAVINMERLRSFSVIGSSNWSQARGRLSRTIQMPKFIAEPGVRARPLASSSGDYGRYLMDLLAHTEGSLRGSFVSLYKFPVSYWTNEQQEISGHYRSYDHWIRFAVQTLQTKMGSMRYKFNTCVALFYTLERGYRPSEIEPLRRPWLAIFRPVDVHIRRPWAETEVLIWDHAAWLHGRGQKTIYMQDLHLAQQELVNSLEIQSQRHLQLPLVQVWLGGQPSDERQTDADALDATLEFIKAMPDSKFGLLPPLSQTLVSRGWRRVERSKPEDASDLSTREGKAVTIFPPPQNPGPSLPLWHNNELYVWAQELPPNKVSKRCNFDFKPTMQWYGEQVRCGQGLNHISVANWESVKKRHFKPTDTDKEKV